MAYSRTIWTDDVTALSAQNLNNIEDGIGELQSQKVDKVSGKGLSTEDFTTAEKTKLSNILSLVYPVGSIYMSVNNVNPSSLFGGTWVAWGSGRVPVGVNTSDSSFRTVELAGGSQTHTHTNPSTGASSAANTGGTTLTAAQSGNQAQTITTGGMSANSTKYGSVNFRLWGASGYPIVNNDGVFSLSMPAASAVGTFAEGNTSTIGNQAKLTMSMDISHTHSVSVAAKNATTAHSHSMAHTHTIGSTGSASNLQPYITCYMWKRTA